MDRSRFIIACTLLILAMSLAARIFLVHESKPVEAAPKTAAQGRSAEIPASRGYSATKNHPVHARPANQQTPELTVRSGTASDHTGNGVTHSPEARASRVEAHARDTGNGGTHSPDARASRVEAHARAKLDELDRHLHLRSDQMRRIFPLLARSAPDYDPNMLISGTPGHQLERVQRHTSDGAEAGSAGDPPDLSAAIINELDAGQQAIYEELLVDDLLWWSEIIAQIEADFMNTNPDGLPLEPAVIDDSGAGENLFDLLGR